MNNYMNNIYVNNEYIVKNESLHEEDSPWKIEKILPLIDNFIGLINKKQINLLDVGGGAGLILNAVSMYIEGKYKIKVNKVALDLSSKMLEIQKKNNPDLEIILNEDIEKTSLVDKEIDLALMIDVLEHTPDPMKVLAEIRRISKYAIFKVPLEDNLFNRIYNLFNNNKIKKHALENFGHINTYNLSVLFGQIKKQAGQIVYCYFANTSDYLRRSEYYRNGQKLRRKLIYIIIGFFCKLSPKLCSLIFDDSAMILIRCYE